MAVTPDASHLVICSRSLSMRIYALHPSDSGIDAKLTRSLKPHTTPVVTCAVDSTGSLLATGGADGVVKVWDIRAGYTTHTFHGHSGVISALRFFQAEATAEGKSSTSKKRKSRDDEEDENEATAGFRLASGSEDGKIRIWDLRKRKSVATLDSHASVVRSLDYSPQQSLLLSGSRDKTAILWDARTWQIHSTIPALEAVESAGFISGSSYFYTGGETARLRIWSVESGSEVTEEQAPGTDTEAIVDVFHFPDLQFLLSIHADQTLVLHSLVPLSASESQSLQPLPIIRRISGTHDEVIDLAYIGSKRDKLALATNLEDLRLISLDTNTASQHQSAASSPYFGADIALLKGHSDIIITIDTDWSGHWLATGAKDNTAKLWRLDPTNESYTCYSTFTGHAESIGAVSLPNASPQVGSKEYNDPLQHPPRFLITGSQDKTIKRWDIAASPGKTPRAAYTRKAHDKDINAIETSYSSTSTLFASASQDRTVKIWDVETGEAIGVLRGHKRGVWSVAFSPPSTPALTTNEAGGASGAKGMVVTGSGDKIVRIWSLGDYSCLRTFEGHANSVLKVVWLPTPETVKGRARSAVVQVASAAGDGLVKVWDVQAGECAATLDNHVDRVWALAVKPLPILSREEHARRQVKDAEMPDEDEGDDDEVKEFSLELVSGSADSTLTFWTDTTVTTALQASSQATARIEQDQELQNHIRASDYREAIVLALQLNHPKRLLDLFTAVVNGPQDAGSLTGSREADQVLGSLSDSQLWSLLRRLRDWNANARTHNVAQHILYAILRLYPKEKLLNLRKRRKAGAPQDEELVDAMAELDTGTRDRAGGKESVKDVVDGLKAYTERHYSRLEKLAEERFVLLWALQQMDEVGGGEGTVNGLVNGHGHGHEDAQDVGMADGVT